MSKATSDPQAARQAIRWCMQPQALSKMPHLTRASDALLVLRTHRTNASISFVHEHCRAHLTDGSLLSASLARLRVASKDLLSSFSRALQTSTSAVSHCAAGQQG